jgi:hypothetical protein
VKEILVRGLVQAPVAVAQGLDEITRFREGNPLSERDVDVATAVGGVVLDPTGTAGMQPGLHSLDVGLDPVNTGNGRVKVQENGRTGPVLPENAHSSRKGGKCTGQGPLVFLRIGLSAVAGKADARLSGKQESQCSPGFGRTV